MKNIFSDEEYNKYIYDILESKKFSKISSLNQHGVTDRLEHSINVSYNLYLLCKRFGLDSKSGARAGLLHDYCSDIKLNPINHPKQACINAELEFDLTEKEKDIILKHMWPVCFGMPKYPETWLIVIVDKYCALKEYFMPTIKRIKEKNKVTSTLR